MAYFKAAKVVAAVPNPPEPDTIYLVRKGEGFDLWATNGIGTIVAYPLNQDAGLDLISQAEAEAGDGTAVKGWSAQRVRQSTEYWWGSEKVFTNTSGSYNSRELKVKVAPSGNSSARTAASRTSLSIEGSTTGSGWVTGSETNVSVESDATVDKILNASQYMQFGSGAKVGNVLGNELIVNYVAADADVDNLVMVYLPDLSAVQNISRIKRVALAVSDFKGAFIRIWGQYLKRRTDTLVEEMAPQQLPMRIANRYYPCFGASSATPATIFNCPAGYLVIGYINIPHELTLKTLGIVTNAASGNGKVALYRPSPAGLLGQLVWGSGNISLSGNGLKNAAADVELEAGGYYAVFIANANVDVSVRANNKAFEVFGRPSMTDEGVTPFIAVGAYPPSFPADMSSYGPSGHLAAFMPEFYYTV